MSPEDGVKIRATLTPVAVEFDPSCEALIFDEEGNALQAISGTGKPRPLPDVHLRTEHRIPSHAVGAGRYTIIIEVACNNLMGNGGDSGDFAFAEPDVSHFRGFRDCPRAIDTCR